jgi:hypothetical protein
MKEGRPTKLTPEIIKQAKNYCILGATDVELASFFQVAVSTIYEWKNVNPQFSEATTRGKEESNARVESSLFTRACGYDKDSKHYPADVKAISLWLRNRDPDRWKDLKERMDHHTVTGDPEINSTELARRIVHLINQGLIEQAPTQH